ELVIANAVLRRNLAGITVPQRWSRGNLVRTVGAIVPSLNPRRDQADDATLSGGAGIQGVHIGGQFMQVGGENRTDSQAAQDTHEILGDVEAFPRIGAG